jgi:hypothetical protein
MEIEQLQVAAGLDHGSLDHQSADVGIPSTTSAEERRSPGQIRKVNDG